MYHAIYDGHYTDHAFMQDATNAIGPIDLVADDNGNPTAVQIAAFQALVPNLRPGGAYAIQDLEGSYSTQGERPNGAVAYFRKLAAELVQGPGGMGIGAVHFSRNNVVITKAGTWEANEGAYGVPRSSEGAYGHGARQHRDSDL